MAEAAYAPTPPGVVEQKQIPAALAYQSSTEATFFEARNQLFRQDFRFLSANGLAMTVPVEADVSPGAMRFLVPEGATPHVAVDGVEVLERPAHHVVSAGLRGGYTERNYVAGLEKLEAWLSEHPEWQPVQEPYAVYWDGPFKPAFLRRSEVHQEIVAA